MGGYLRKRITGPMQAIGGFFKMCVLTGKALARPFQWKEFVQSSWFLMTVTLLPTFAMSIPLTVLIIFTSTCCCTEFGAADVSGAGAALASVTQLGPLVTVLVVAGAGSTAICADLGARTIREEIDALEVLGIDPIHRLVVPRVVAVDVRGRPAQRRGDHHRPGRQLHLRGLPAEHLGRCLLSTLTLVTGLPEVVISIVKALTFGLIAGLVGCYRGLTVGGGAKGVGIAVNETLVLCVVALFAVNVIFTTIGVRFGTGR